MSINGDFEQFCNEFDIVKNALEMRTLVRWNGRDLLQKENLAEHTHLVAACVLHLADSFRKDYDIPVSLEDELSAVKLALIHDSLELLRGDILSITKDKTPGLRQSIETEERLFYWQELGQVSDIAHTIAELADLMACYKFLERELRFPNNDFCKQVYISCKAKYDVALEKFLTARVGKRVTDAPDGKRFVKGYQHDAGVDIVLDRGVVFLPMSTTMFDLNVQITPKEGEMGLLCARTSAAAKGLSVAMCPIDPHFEGNCTAIVHNVSNQVIEYRAGESFCQYIMIKMIEQDAAVKKPGTRSLSKLGGTDQ